MNRITTLYLDDKDFTKFQNKCNDLNTSASKEIRKYIKRVNNGVSET